MFDKFGDSVLTLSWDFKILAILEFLDAFLDADRPYLAMLNLLSTGSTYVYKCGEHDNHADALQSVLSNCKDICSPSSTTHVEIVGTCRDEHCDCGGAMDVKTYFIGDIVPISTSDLRWGMFEVIAGAIGLHGRTKLDHWTRHMYFDLIRSRESRLPSPKEDNV